MIVKLLKRDRRPLYINAAAVILAEQTPSGGWLVTVNAQVVAQVGRAAVSRVLDLDEAGAKPLVDHFDACIRSGNAP